MKQGFHNGVKVNFIELTSELTYGGRNYLVYFNNSLWTAYQVVNIATGQRGDINIKDKVVDASIPEYDKLLKQ